MVRGHEDIHRSGRIDKGSGYTATPKAIHDPLHPGLVRTTSSEQHAWFHYLLSALESLSSFQLHAQDLAPSPDALT